MLLKARKKIIRLRKKGMIYYPIYDIVVSYKDIRNRGIILEKLGFYNPHINKKIIYINSFSLCLVHKFLDYLSYTCLYITPLAVFFLALSVLEFTIHS